MDEVTELLNSNAAGGIRLKPTPGTKSFGEHKRTRATPHRIWHANALNLMLIVGFGVTQTALAQQAATTATTAQTAPSDTLQEVVVTAERRSTDVLTTAISVQALSGGTLAAKQDVTVADLQKTVPNYQVNQTGLYDSINIRGIGNTAITPVIQPGVAVFHDGLLSPETVFIDVPFYDIADVEVLRGPQGTLVSAASTGGSVQINSNNPNFNGIGGYIEGLAGNYSDNKLDGVINLPVSDTIAARVAFNVEKRGSYYSDVTSTADPQPSAPYSDPGQVDQENIRVGILWQPSGSYNALLKFEDNYNNPGGQAGQPNTATFAPIVSGGVTLPCPNGANAAGQCYASAYATYGTGRAFTLNFENVMLGDKQTNRRVMFDQHLTLPNGIVLRSLTGFQTFNSLETETTNYSSYTPTPNNPFYDNTGPRDNYYSEDLSLLSPTGGRLSYIFGADWFYRYTPVEIRLNPTNAAPVQVDGDIDATAITEGLFGNVDYKITDTITLDVGLRGNWDQFWNRGYQCVYIVSPAGCDFVNPLNNISYTPGYTPTAKDHLPTGKLGVNWQPNEQNFVYAFFARGYKPGNNNTSALGSPPSPNFQPEHVNDWELGWKGKLMDNHIQLQVGGYYMNYQDMQFTEYLPSVGGTIPFNVGSSTIDGVEFTGDGQFGQFSVNVNMAYLNSMIGNAPNQIATYKLPAYVSQFVQLQCAPGQTPGGNAPGCFDYGPYTHNISGEVNPYSPKFTGTIDLSYRMMFAEDSLTPDLSFSHTDRQYGSLFQTDSTQVIGARNLLDASATFAAGMWTVQAYCNNLTGQIYYAGLANDGSEVYYGAPRTFGLRLKRTF